MSLLFAGGESSLQQLREAIPSDHAYRFIIHDRDSIFSAGFDASASGLGLRVIKTPVRSPKANSLCERLIGTLRRECLDWIIPLTEQHLRKTLMLWLSHYNRGRPHSLELRRNPRPARLAFSTPEKLEALAVPTDEGFGCHDRQCLWPIELAAEPDERQTSWIVEPPRLHSTFLIERELLAQEEILGRERRLRS